MGIRRKDRKRRRGQPRAIKRKKDRNKIVSEIRNIRNERKRMINKISYFLTKCQIVRG